MKYILTYDIITYSIKERITKTFTEQDHAQIFRNLLQREGDMYRNISITETA